MAGAAALTFSTGVAAAVAPAARTDAAALRARGLDLGYNLDHAEALSAFREAEAADPDDSRAFTLSAATAWTELLFRQGAVTVDDYLGQARANLPRPAPDPTLAAAFHEAIQQATKLSEARLHQHPADAEAHYEVGAAYGFLASYTATVEGHLLDSLGSARHALQEHERVLALDPLRADAGLIVGMYRYAVSNLSLPLRIMARLAGFRGDRERAVHLVEDAARAPSDVRANAQFMLVLIYNQEARYDDALRVIRQLQEQFPRNRLLWLEESRTALKAGRADDALRAVEKGRMRLSVDPRPRAAGEEARWRYAQGAALVALRNPTAADAELLSALAAGATRDWVRGRIHKELGKSADLAGDHRRAVTEYETADRLCRADDDAECAEELKTLKRRGYQ